MLLYPEMKLVSLSSDLVLPTNSSVMVGLTRLMKFEALSSSFFAA
jgi:hypothetical protein